jgi:ssDNA-binding replication factor A large subunit
MLKIPIEEIVSKIKEKTGLDDSLISKKIEDKIHELSGLVSREGAAHIVANEFGVKLFKPSESGRLQIKNILPGLRNVSFLGRVLNLFPVRSYKTDKKEGKIGTMMLGDETGKIRVVMWDTNHIQLIEDGKIKQGDILKIKQGYVRESRMVEGIEVHLSGNSSIEINPADADIKKIPEAQAVISTAERVRIADVNEGFHQIRGAIVNIIDANPFYDVCPQCGKRARDNVCAEHGEVTPKQSLVISAIVDDGSDNMRVVFFGQQASQILGMSAEEAYKEAQEHANNNYPIEAQRIKMLGKEIVVEGKVSKNSFSNELEMVGRKILAPNYPAEAKKLLGEV